MYFGLLGGFLFILIQLVFIIEFAHSLAEKFVAKYEETNSRLYFTGINLLLKVLFVFFVQFHICLFYKICIRTGLLSFTAFNYAVMIAAVVLLSTYYGHEGCGMQKFLIWSTFVLSIFMSIFSIHPSIQASMFS